MKCGTCGGGCFTNRAVLWDELASTWELSPGERAYVDRQQGTCCTTCGSNLRSGALARAITTSLGLDAPLRACVAAGSLTGLAVLEINEAGTLSADLSRLHGHTLATYPDVDMQALPYPDGSFDLVIHSDTLEHVPDPLKALAECRRVLKPGGSLCFTVPTIVGRLTRSCEGRPASYHGAWGSEEYRVVTEFGADAWSYCLRAGFEHVTINAVDYPAATAMTARAGRGDGAPVLV